MEPVLGVFTDRILNEFLPLFCDDPSRAWGRGGFKEDWNKVADLDATDFLRGIDGGLVEHMGRGQYLAPRSSAKEQFFWSGRRSESPRPLTLWVEPIITIAVLARLHFDLGWPRESLAAQPQGWAFDAAVYFPAASMFEFVVCEVKKSERELSTLIDLMKRFGNTDSKERPRRSEQNSFKKVQALRSRRPPLFWAVGPGGTNHAFRLEYAEEGVVHFQEITVQELAYPLNGNLVTTTKHS